MNEHGLFYDGASCPPSEVPYDSQGEPGYNLGDIVLAKCRNMYTGMYRTPAGKENRKGKKR